VGATSQVVAFGTTVECGVWTAKKSLSSSTASKILLVLGQRGRIAVLLTDSGRCAFQTFFALGWFKCDFAPLDFRAGQDFVGQDVLSVRLGVEPCYVQQQGKETELYVLHGEK
jgi:hypothetical protein